MEARKLMGEAIDKPQTPPPLSLYIPWGTKQGKFGTELIEEMNKPVITHQPTQGQRSPPTPYFSRFERKR